MDLTLTLLADTFIIHRLDPSADIPSEALRSPFFAIARTDGELSLVLPEQITIESDKAEPGWACFKVEGPLEFGLVGVLAGIAGKLAAAGVSIFALSTFDTDYILIKREQVQAAWGALSAVGYKLRL